MQDTLHDASSSSTLIHYRFHHLSNRSIKENSTFDSRVEIHRMRRVRLNSTIKSHRTALTIMDRKVANFRIAVPQPVPYGRKEITRTATVIRDNRKNIDQTIM